MVMIRGMKLERRSWKNIDPGFLLVLWQKEGREIALFVWTQCLCAKWWHLLFYASLPGSLNKIVVGWIGTLQDVYILIPRTCEYVFAWQKVFFKCDYVWLLRWRDDLRLTSGPSVIGRVFIRGRQEDQSEKGMWKIGVLWPQMPSASEGWKQGKDFHPDLPEVTIIVDTLIFSLPWLLTTRTLRGDVCVGLNHWVCDNFSQQP